MRTIFVLCAVFMVASAGVAVPFRSVLADASSSDPNASVPGAVQSYFVNAPVMVAIAKCESGMREFEPNGAPLYGGTDGAMIGIFQLDSTIHTKPALALGFDLGTASGNIEYAAYLYGAEGTDPWISSFPCWSYATGTNASGTPPAVTIASGTPALTEDLSLGMVGPQVLALQEALNKAGFTLAASGPGSPGDETTKFGALTYAALKKFQCAEGIVCSGDEATTGYGFLNAPTRASLLAVAYPAPVASSTATSTDMATSTLMATTTASITTSTPDDPAVMASLESRLATLIAIVQQLEAEIAARAGH